MAATTISILRSGCWRSPALACVHPFYADGEKPNGDEDVYKYEFRSAHNRVILNYIVKIQLLTASANIQVTNPLLAVTKTAIMAGDFVKMLLNMRIYSLGKGIKL